MGANLSDANHELTTMKKALVEDKAMMEETLIIAKRNNAIVRESQNVQTNVNTRLEDLSSNVASLREEQNRLRSDVSNTFEKLTEQIGSLKQYLISRTGGLAGIGNMIRGISQDNREINQSLENNMAPTVPLERPTTLLPDDKVVELIKQGVNPARAFKMADNMIFLD